MAIFEQVRSRVRAQAQNRCGYCRSLEMYVLGILEIEHIIPKAIGGSDEEENLWLACSLCNNYKGTQADAFDRSRKSTLSCLIRALNNGHKILLGVKTLQKLLDLQIAVAPQSQHYN